MFFNDLIICNSIEFHVIIELCVSPEGVKGNKPSNKLSLYDQLNVSELKDLLLRYNFDTINVITIIDDTEHPGLCAFLCKKVT